MPVSQSKTHFFNMMKHFFWLLAAAGIYSSCKDPSPVPMFPDNSWGEASALKNGQYWVANPICFYDLIDSQKMSIQLGSFMDRYALTEYLSFSGIPLDTGSYELIPLDITQNEKGMATLSYLNYDVGKGACDLLGLDSSNYLVVASYDTLSREIKGRFNLTFIVRKPPYPGAPDTIRFTDGRFHGKLFKK